MRTKTLLLAAAAIAAGVATSVAQSNVYSVNIVGYVNSTIVGNAKYTLLANPLDDGNGNQMTNLVGALPKQSSVLIWDNATAKFVSASKTVAGWSANFPIAQGRGFFVKNGGGSTAGNMNALFVGSAATAATNTLPTGYSLIGNPIPYAGDLTSDTNINLGASLPKQSQLLRWDVPTQKYISVSKTVAGWSGPLSVGAGEGFFVKTPTNTIVWVQTLK